MNNIIAGLVVVVAFLFLFNIYVLYKFYMIKNEIEQLNIEVMAYKNATTSIIRQFVEKMFNISEEKSQS